MCYFITLVVQGADEASIAPVVTRHGRRATPISNRSVASILQPGDVQFLTTVGHCDCATVLIGRSAAQDTEQRAKRVEKLAKRAGLLLKSKGRFETTRRPMFEPMRGETHNTQIASHYGRALFAIYLPYQALDGSVCCCTITPMTWRPKLSR